MHYIHFRMSAYTKGFIEGLLVVVIFILILTTEDVHANWKLSTHSGSHNNKLSNGGGYYSQPSKLSSFQTHNAAPSGPA